MNDLFIDLTTEELDEYARFYVPEEYEQLDICKAFVERTDSLRVQIEHIAKRIDSIQKDFKEKFFSDVYDKCASLSKALSKASMEAAWIPSDFGLFDEKTRKKGMISKEKHVIFDRREEYMHIILPELLPHRMQYDAHTKKMKYFYDYDEWYAGYMPAFQKEFENGKQKLYSEKVVMTYIHHVSEETVKDVDNIETKDMTDIITLFLLFDDSNKYVSHYADMVEDNKDFTEIFICPLKDFASVIKEITPRI